MGAEPGGPERHFWRPGAQHVDAPLVHAHVHAPDGRGRIHVEQRIVLAAGGADLGERLRHGGGRVPVHQRDQRRTMLAQGGDDALGLEHPAPLRLDDPHLRLAAARDLAQQVAEAPEDRHQHPVPRREDRDHGCLDRGPGGAVHEEGPPVAGAKHLPVEGHHVVHVAGQHRIELAQQRHRHRPQHPGVGLDRTRAHEQARRRVQLVGGFAHVRYPWLKRRGGKKSRARKNTLLPVSLLPGEGRAFATGGFPPSRE